MKRIGTQRGFAWNNGDGSLWHDRCGAFIFDNEVTQEVVGSEGNVPVLVIPEADVKGCKHEQPDDEDSNFGVCINCGSWFSPKRGRWQRPRILRARRAKR